MTSLLDRRAAWRSKPASESQRALVERRLGFHKQQSKGIGSTSKEGDAPRLENLTKGMANVILTRLNQGAKGRWTEEAARQNRIFAAQKAEAERRERETVKVGDLI